LLYYLKENLLMCSLHGLKISNWILSMWHWLYNQYRPMSPGQGQFVDLTE